MSPRLYWALALALLGGEAPPRHGHVHALGGVLQEAEAGRVLVGPRPVSKDPLTRFGTGGARTDTRTSSSRRVASLWSRPSAGVARAATTSSCVGRLYARWRRCRHDACSVLVCVGNGRLRHEGGGAVRRQLGHAVSVLLSNNGSPVVFHSGGGNDAKLFPNHYTPCRLRETPIRLSSRSISRWIRSRLESRTVGS